VFVNWREELFHVALKILGFYKSWVSKIRVYTYFKETKVGSLSKNAIEQLEIVEG